MFNSFGKIPRLSRECIITEKLDGTNAQITISFSPLGFGLGPAIPTTAIVPTPGGAARYYIYAGSRNRFISPGDDNFGFAAWVAKHAEELTHLGEGSHFGEWWGGKIGRGYGLKEKRFSLFNTSRWNEETKPECCHVVPVLYQGPFNTQAVDDMLFQLDKKGSVAAPGFMNPEGVIVFHTALNGYFKKTIHKDEEPKSK